MAATRVTLVDLVSLLEQEDWHFEVDWKRQRLRFLVYGDGPPYDCTVSLDNVRSLVLISVGLPYRYAPKHFAAALETVSRANFGLRFTTLQIDPQRRTFTVDAALPVHGSGLVRRQFLALLNAAIHVAEQYAPALFAVLSGRLSPAAAVRGAEQEIELAAGWLASQTPVVDPKRFVSKERDAPVQ